jgi:hypothetical protein
MNRSADVLEGVRHLGIDAVIGVGSDGSFTILRRLGINLVGIPKRVTISRCRTGVLSRYRSPQRSNGRSRWIPAAHGWTLRVGSASACAMPDVRQFRRLMYINALASESE